MERLRLEDIAILSPINLRVAIVTQLIYPDHPEKQAYETMVWSLEGDRGIRINHYIYKTERKAREGHQKIVNSLKVGKYEITPTRWILELKE